MGGYYGKKGIYGNEETALIETATHPLSFAKPNTLSPENQTLLAHCHNAINHRAISRLTPTQPKNRGYITHINRPQVKFWTDRRQHQTRILNAANPAPQTAKKKNSYSKKMSRDRGSMPLSWGSSSETQSLKRWNSATSQVVANDATHLLISIEAHLLALGQVNRENRSWWCTWKKYHTVM